MKNKLFKYSALLFASVLTAINMVAQQPVNYLMNQSVETIYAEVAQESIVSGETLWFKILVTNGAQMTSQDLSKVAYVELIAPDGKAVIQAKILLEHGSGNGSWVVPNSLSGGIYKLKAYTRWAKTYGHDAVFSRNIQIINPNKYDPNAAIESNLQKSNRTEFEGGSFIVGLKNTLYFAAEKDVVFFLLKDNNIVDSTQDKTSTIRSFIIKGEKGSTYAIKNSKTGELTVLKKPEEQGWHFEISKLAGTDMQFYMERTAFASSSPTFFLVLHTNQEIIEAQQFKSGDLKYNGIFHLNRPFEGVATVSMLDADKKLIAETSVLFPFQESSKLSVSTDKPVYKSRETGVLKISELDSTTLTNLTVRIRKIDDQPSQPSTNLNSYFRIISKLPEIPLDQQNYINSNSGDFEKVKPIMVLYGSHHDSLEQKLQYAPELSGHLISGTVRNRKTLEPVEGIRTYLSIPGDRFYFNYAQSDKQGHFVYDVKRCFGVESFIIQTNSQKDSGYIIEIDNPFLTHKGFSTTTNPEAASNEPNLLKRIQNAQLQNGINSVKRDQYFLPNYNDSTPFFGKADIEYNLDDYTRFTTMEEILREYVVEVDVKKTSNGFRIRVLNVPFKELFLEDPLVLYDGVPIFDMNKVMSLDPLKIAKLEVVSRRFLLGAHAFDGVINISSYKKDLNGLQLDSKALAIEYQGLQLQRQFSAPNYSNKELKNQKLPDLRTLLLWEPENLIYQKSSHSINFNTSDITGTFIVEISGISNTGKLVSASRSFTVTE